MGKCKGARVSCVCGWCRLGDGSGCVGVGCGAGVRSVRRGPVVQVTGAASARYERDDSHDTQSLLLCEERHYVTE